MILSATAANVGNVDWLEGLHSQQNFTLTNRGQLESLFSECTESSSALRRIHLYQAEVQTDSL
jgi:hypothetical protein